MWDRLWEHFEAEWGVISRAPFAAVLSALVGVGAGWWLSDLLNSHEIEDLKATAQLSEVRAAAFQEKYCNIPIPSRQNVRLGEALQANVQYAQNVKVLNAELQACADDRTVSPEQKGAFWRD